MRVMRPHEELFWQRSPREPVPKKPKLEPTPQECYKPVPQQGSFTDVPHPELYAVEPSMGKSVVVMQSPLMSRNAYDNNPGWQGPRIDPEPLVKPVIVAYAAPRTNSDASSNPPDANVEPEDVASNVSTHAHNDSEDIVSVQFSSICSPFLATIHVPCSQAGHISTTPH